MVSRLNGTPLTVCPKVSFPNNNETIAEKLAEEGFNSPEQLKFLSGSELDELVVQLGLRIGIKARLLQLVAEMKKV